MEYARSFRGAPRRQRMARHARPEPALHAVVRYFTGHRAGRFFRGSPRVRPCRCKPGFHAQRDSFTAVHGGGSRPCGRTFAVQRRLPLRPGVAGEPDGRPGSLERRHLSWRGKKAGPPPGRPLLFRLRSDDGARDPQRPFHVRAVARPERFFRPRRLSRPVGPDDGGFRGFHGHLALRAGLLLPSGMLGNALSETPPGAPDPLHGFVFLRHGVAGRTRRGRFAGKSSAHGGQCGANHRSRYHRKDFVHSFRRVRTHRRTPPGTAQDLWGANREFPHLPRRPVQRRNRLRSGRFGCKGEYGPSLRGSISRSASRDSQCIALGKRGRFRSLRFERGRTEPDLRRCAPDPFLGRPRSGGRLHRFFRRTVRLPGGRGQARSHRVRRGHGGVHTGSRFGSPVALHGVAGAAAKVPVRRSRPDGMRRSFADDLRDALHLRFRKEIESQRLPPPGRVGRRDDPAFVFRTSKRVVRHRPVHGDHRSEFRRGFRRLRRAHDPLLHDGGSRLPESDQHLPGAVLRLDRQDFVVRKGRTGKKNESTGQGRIFPVRAVSRHRKNSCRNTGIPFPADISFAHAGKEGTVGFRSGVRTRSAGSPGTGDRFRVAHRFGTGDSGSGPGFPQVRPAFPAHHERGQIRGRLRPGNFAHAGRSHHGPFTGGSSGFAHPGHPERRIRRG